MAFITRLVAAAALSLAVLSSAPSSVNAVSVEHVNHNARGSHHDRIVRLNKKATGSKQRRCKPRTSSLAPTSTKAAATTSAAPTTSKAAETTSVAPETTKKAQTTSAAPPPPTTSAKATSTKAAEPSSSPKPVSSGGGKVGLVWANDQDDKLSHYVTSKTKYLYTWKPSCPSSANGLDINCMRMLWGPAQVDKFRQLRQSSGTNILMGMNEVNEPSQAYMSVEDGISLWNSEIRWLGNQGYKLISPAVTMSDTGFAWHKGFFAGCGGNDNCGVDGLAVHFYQTTAAEFKTSVTKWYNQFKIPIWVTEFACQNFNGGAQCTKQGVWDFMSEVTSWMDQTSWVEAYFAFGALRDLSMWGVNTDNALMDPNSGLPTDLGYFYINA